MTENGVGALKEHHVHTLYILTNDRSEWLANLKSRLEAHQWRIVTSSDLVHRNAQEKDVAMATDMDLARRAAIFLGNGVRSFLYPRMASSLIYFL